jgi:ceramide glucosyltransferase
MSFLLLLIALDGIVVVAAYVLFAIPATLHGIMYRTFHLRRYDASYSPTISMFIPCKGAGDNLQDNVEAFLRGQYRKARLFFVVEDEQDAAYPIIKRLTEDREDATLIVAGRAESCGQKNHNLLQAIRAAERKDDIYVFLDSFMTITDEQLHDLVTPLSNPGVTVAVGFRWDILRLRTLGERLRAFMIALQWSLLGSSLVYTTWGGGTAIRREDFEKMGVAAYWGKTVVDDMALARLLRQQRRVSVLVPTCIKETASTFTTVSEAIIWFRRQALYVKFYLKPYWLMALGLLVCISANVVSLPLLFAWSLARPGRMIRLVTAVTGVSIAAIMVCCFLLKRPAADHHGRLSWVLLSPLFIVLSCWAYLLGVFVRVLHWRGIAYYLDRNGYVERVVRL